MWFSKPHMYALRIYFYVNAKDIFNKSMDSLQKETLKLKEQYRKTQRASHEKERVTNLHHGQKDISKIIILWRKNRTFVKHVKKNIITNGE